MWTLALAGAVADGAVHGHGQALRVRLEPASGSAPGQRWTAFDEVYGEFPAPAQVRAYWKKSRTGAARHRDTGPEEDFATHAIFRALTRTFPGLELLPLSTQRSMLMTCAAMHDSCAYPADHPHRTAKHTFFVDDDRGLCLLREASPLVHELISAGRRSFALVTVNFRPDAGDRNLPVFRQLDVASVDDNATLVSEFEQAQLELAPQFWDKVMQAAKLALPGLSLRVLPIDVPEAAPGSGFDLEANVKGTWVEFASGGMMSLAAMRAVGLVNHTHVLARGGRVSFGIERLAMVASGTLHINDVA